MSHPLSPLVAPLRFASQRDFAALGTVKGLRRVLSQAIEAAEQAGLPPETLAPLRAELPVIDHRSLLLRRASVRRVIGALPATGLVLPPELGGLVRFGTERERSTEVQAGRGVVEGVIDGRESDAARTGGASLHDPGPPGGFGEGAVTRLASERRTPAAVASPSDAGVAPASAPESEATASKRAVRTGRSEAKVTRGSDQAQAEAAASDAPRSEKRRPTPTRSRNTKSRETGASATKGRAKGKGARTEARILSIAPRTGPLSLPLSEVQLKISPRVLQGLSKRGLHRLGDVLFLLPRRYEDRRRLRRIAELVPGSFGVTVATVRAFEEVPVRRGGRRTWKAILRDESGSIAAVHFFGGGWLKGRYPVDRRLVLSGEVRASFGAREMVHPDVEPADDLEQSPVHFRRIVPVYPGFERHEQRAVRELAYRIGERYAREIEEPLPEALRARLGFMTLGEALFNLHFPPHDADIEALTAQVSEAHQRLAFDELFFLQLGLALKRQGVKVEPGIAFEVNASTVQAARGILPFRFTPAQEKVFREIARDMARSEPMHRLVQGDVGSGKTAVAASSAMIALQAGYQVAVMAPTELLAQQHLLTFKRMLGSQGVSCALVSASGKAKEKRAAREALGDGRVRLAVGTHALLEEAVAFEKLGLIIIDEQHRFGVLQRHRLMQKGLRPDVLVMTATPIPRTLAMAVHGDLDVSVIDALPPGRTPIETRVFPETQRDRVHALVEAELAKGHQAYVVFPLVAESEKVDLTDATRGAERLKERFPDREVGLLHGRLSAEEKDAVMQRFRDGALHLLVATTVVEVGVDVPNASVMVIEGAERFGLSQLHQLRGRVGRGAAASRCYLVSGKAVSAEGAARLSVMEQSSDGFVIAQRDLELRGPGELLGTRQSGVPELAVANLARDVHLLELAQVEARRIVAGDPQLTSQEHAPLIRALEERWEGRLALATVG